MLDAVLRKEKLFEPEEILNALKSLGHRVSRATVYRTLSHLQDAGIVKQVFFDNRQSYYEVIVGRETHDHLICVSSGRVIEFSSQRLRELRDEICREHGFEPLSHQFHIFGLSPEARQEAGAGVGAVMGSDGAGAAGPARPIGTAVNKEPRTSPT
jgi:Fur family ferric uptake transcriptional regulator